jgi:EAL domain-containing protein (putative c-di-GMP-specific phosphodiesterase class I)
MIAIPAEHLIAEFPREARQNFCIEISEQQILGDPVYLLDTVETLRQAGLRIAVDDVGYGNSCLESLVLLEPDIIKIDKRCVRGIERELPKQRHLERYLSVANELGAEVIAEGVERREELEVLKRLGVEFGQGFLWGAPA